MYKDKNKQREANRQAQARFKAKGITKGITDEGITDRVLPEGYIGAVPCAPPILDPNLKRGKDIKVFADLPPDIQETIDKMSKVDGAIDQTVKANRTAIAVNYQHLFPDRYHPSSQDFKETSEQLSLITNG